MRSWPTSWVAAPALRTAGCREGRWLSAWIACMPGSAPMRASHPPKAWCDQVSQVLDLRSRRRFRESGDLRRSQARRRSRCGRRPRGKARLAKPPGRQFLSWGRSSGRHRPQLHEQGNHNVKGGALWELAYGAAWPSAKRQHLVYWASGRLRGDPAVAQPKEHLRKLVEPGCLTDRGPEVR